RGMVGRQAADQLDDAVAQLQGEVGGGGAHELADVVDRDLAVRAQAGGMLGFAHGRRVVLVVVVVLVGVVEVLVFLAFDDFDGFDGFAGVVVGCCAVLTGAISS